MLLNKHAWVGYFRHSKVFTSRAKNPPSTPCKSTSLNLPSSSEPSVLRDKVQGVVDFKMELSMVSFSLLFNFNTYSGLRNNF